MTPGVVVHEYQSPRVRELRASEILIKATSSVINSAQGRPAARGLEDELRNSIVNMVKTQAGVRGMSLSSELPSISVSVSEHGGISVDVPEDWEELVDLALRNYRCARCGHVATTSEPHGRLECDTVIVTHVMET